MYTEQKYREIERVRFVAINNYLDVDDLVIMLEISPEDLLDRFEDRMYEHKEKFIPDGYCDTDLPEEETVAQEEPEEQIDDYS